MSRCTRSGLGALLSVVLIAAACGTDRGVSTERAEPGAAATVPTTAEAPTGEPPTDAATTDPPTSDGPTTVAPTDAPAATPSTAPVTAGPPAVIPTPTLAWQDFGENLQYAFLEVPVDYDDPAGPTFQLFVVRHLALDQENKIGSLLVNPGGPGFGGSDLAFSADSIYLDPLLQRFDIVGWDPRGTGYSQPAVDCIDDYDEYVGGTDITPDGEAERQQLVDDAKAFADDCVSENGAVIQHVGTNDSARDIDLLRRALGEEKISYFGFSYGSELGATWATLFPDTVRAAVLDGASDPAATPLEANMQQARGFENTLATYLASCSDDTSCPFHNDGDAEGAFDALMAQLDEQPIPTEDGRPDLTRAMAMQGVAEAMYTEILWPQLSEALAGAQHGDGAGLLGLVDSYFRRRLDGTWGNELEAFQSIRCADRVERPTVAEDDATMDQIRAVAPRFVAATTGEYMCTFFPPSLDPRIKITAAGAGPLVVIGTTGDAATPLDSTRAMASQVEDGRLVVVTADQHTGYKVNDCVNDVVHGYLVDLEVPPAETMC